MNAPVTFSKTCYRCDKAVEMTGEQFLGVPRYLDTAPDWTICAKCRHDLEIEAHYAAPANPEIPRGITEANHGK